MSRFVGFGLKDGYRFLEEEEPVQKGDFFAVVGGGWVKSDIFSHFIGEYPHAWPRGIYGIDYAFCRKIKDCTCDIMILMRKGCQCQA